MLIIPARLNKSEITLDFILWSNIESQAREGERLTSSSHGFKALSIKISNPNNSKQFFLWGTNISKELFNIGSADIIVFITISSIFLKIALSSTPYYFNTFLSPLIDHFDPTFSLLGSLFYTNAFLLNLFIE